MENNKKQFKPFDRILVRDRGEWTPDIYSYYSKSYNQHWCLSFGWLEDEANILPYEGNEHLVGTTDSPDEEVRLEEGEWILPADIIRVYEKVVNCIIRQFDYAEGDLFKCKNSSAWALAIRLKDFNPSDMEETRKHILCVKNGKIVRYKG